MPAVQYIYILLYNYNTYISNNLEIDECGDGICTQTCINTDGSFICGCISGYLLDVDGTSCNGMFKELLVLFW